MEVHRILKEAKRVTSCGELDKLQLHTINMHCTGCWLKQLATLGKVHPKH